MRHIDFEHDPEELEQVAVLENEKKPGRGVRNLYEWVDACLLYTSVLSCETNIMSRMDITEEIIRGMNVLMETILMNLRILNLRKNVRSVPGKKLEKCVFSQ